jgi:hypothetical protein
MLPYNHIHIIGLFGVNDAVGTAVSSERSRSP